MFGLDPAGPAVAAATTAAAARSSIVCPGAFNKFATAHLPQSDRTINIINLVEYDHT